MNAHAFCAFLTYEAVYTFMIPRFYKLFNRLAKKIRRNLFRRRGGPARGRRYFVKSSMIERTISSASAQMRASSPCGVEPARALRR